MKLEKIRMPEMSLFCLVTELYHGILHHHLCYVLVVKDIIQVAFFVLSEAIPTRDHSACNFLNYVLRLEHLAD